MVHHLYANFLEDKKIYNLAQGYWQRLFYQLSQSQQLQFVSYLNPITHNGEKEYDGNPIFNAWEKNLNRAVRIIQVAPQGDAMDVSAWLDSIELQENEAPVPELVLDIVLSKESYAVASKLISTWFNKNMTKGTMEALIEQEITLP